MLPEEKQQEIRKKIKRGYPQGELINDYIKLGYTEDEIRDALNKQSNSNASGKNTADVPVWYVISIGLLITGISILSIFPGATLGIFFLAPGIAGAIIRLVMKASK